ncbi:MAG TPA: FAD-binding protein [Candidatus Methylomirabilis sp.]|jgi:fumarate reductase (CoM/CoB) subunit A
MNTVDVLVVGGGCAGLRAAGEAAGLGARVLLVNKGRIGRTGCSAFLDHRIEYSLMNIPDQAPDSPARYLEDLLACGAGRNDRTVVEAFVEGILHERDVLQRLGMRFRQEGGRPRRLQLPGHSCPRSLVCEAGFGRKLLGCLSDLARSRGAELREGVVALDLLRAGARVAGALVAYARTGEVAVVGAGAVVLAAGGVGNAFPLTTNPPDIAGDGVALAWRAGAALRDMELVQCYPLTASPPRGTYLVSGILLAGRVINRLGEAFAFEAPAGLALHAARKARLRALCEWMAAEAAEDRGVEGRSLEWDGTAIPRETYEAEMPATYAALRRGGADLLRDRIRIAPGAHQMLGGLGVNGHGATSLPGLYAAGEDMGGLHGADRLSGTGILEGLTFGRLAARAAVAFAAAAGPAPPEDTAATTPAGGGPWGRRPSLQTARALERRIAEAMDPLLVRRDPAEARRALAVLEGIRAAADAAQFDPGRPRPSLRMHRVRNLALTATLMASAMAGR